ncbi:uncharacterized protein BDV14DRAFT_204012 [Aspergillus stella-maris]|uniref:uncharacterized protein n=1 Tax=Aspergillus stella-maris TaxID=1810926 RepID=UPI003CCCF51F
MPSSTSFFSRLRQKKRGNSPVEPEHEDEPITTHETQPVKDHVQSTQSENTPNLWNTAYDCLKIEENELVDTYERILSRELKGSAGGNIIGHGDARKRQLQMEELLQVGKTRLERRDNVKKAVGKAMQGVLALNDVIGAALQPVPQAALAWVGVSFALQILVNPTTESTANRTGIIYVTSRMDWYCELSQLLLKENTVDRGTPTGLRSQLEGQLVNLYKLLLLYLIRAICSFHRNRVVNYLQGMVKFNDWEGSVQSIKAAELVVQQDAANFNTQQIRSPLEQLISFAQNQETNFLSNVEQAIQDQSKLQDLCLTDPRDDMDRIEQSKGRLLKDSWNPGKGKTMLMIGIIQEMLQATQDTGLVSFFFCQKTDPNLDNATAILRGLIYQLAVQENALISYIRSEYDSRGRSLFEDANAFFALSRILSKILDHPSLSNVYLVVDALDECQTDLQPLLELIMQHTSPRLRWLVASRPGDDIRGVLNVDSYTELDLDRDAVENVRTVVSAYINYEVANLLQQKKYNPKLQQEIKDYLQLHADDTFLWVALVCQQLRQTILWKTLSVLKSFPSGLKPLFQRMMESMKGLGEESPEVLDYCRRILAAVTLALRPLHLSELGLVAGLEPELVEDHVSLVEISAKDYLSTHGRDDIFPEGVAATHSEIVSQALKEMANTLHRDIWNLHDPGSSIKVFQAPILDPLAHIGYVCTHWIYHICELDADTQQGLGLCDGGEVEDRQRGEMISKLEQSLTIISSKTTQLLPLVTDAKHFVGYHQHVIAATPLQIYSSTLVFSPASSPVKRLFEDQIPSWIKRVPSLDTDWNMQTEQIVQTFKCQQEGRVESVAFSSNDNILVSRTALVERPISVWNVQTGEHLRFLENHTEGLTCTGVSSDAQVTIAEYHALRIWDAYTGALKHTISIEKYRLALIDVSPAGDVALCDGQIQIWNTSDGKIKETFGEFDQTVLGMTLSPVGTRLAVKLLNGGIQIWESGKRSWSIIQALETGSTIIAMRFSGDGRKLAIISGPRVHVWDTAIPENWHTPAAHSKPIVVIRASPCGKWLLTGTIDEIGLWDRATGLLVRTVDTSRYWTVSLKFSHDARHILCTGADDKLVAWVTQTGDTVLTGHCKSMRQAIFSPDGRRVLASSRRGTVCIWSLESGDLERTIATDEELLSPFAWSLNGLFFASSSLTGLKIWNAETQAVQEVSADHDFILGIAFSHDGQYLACSTSECIWVYDIETEVTLHALDPGSISATDLRFSEGGSHLFTNNGCIALPSEPSFRGDNDDHYDPANWVGYGLNVFMEITYNGKPLLKLPP